MVANGRQTVAQLRDVLVEGFKVSWQDTLSPGHTFAAWGVWLSEREREREREGKRKRVRGRKGREEERERERE